MFAPFLEKTLDAGGEEDCSQVASGKFYKGHYHYHLQPTIKAKTRQLELVCSALIIYASTLGVALHRQGVTGCLVDLYRTLKTLLQKLLEPTK